MLRAGESPSRRVEVAVAIDNARTTSREGTATPAPTTSAGSDTPQAGEVAGAVKNEDGGAVKCGTFGNRQGLRAKMEGGPFCHAMSL